MDAGALRAGARTRTMRAGGPRSSERCGPATFWQGKRIVETAESETAQVQALNTLARMFPLTFSTGGAGGQSTRVNVIAGAGSTVQVSTSLGAGLSQDESRAIAERALRELAGMGAGAPDVIEGEAREVEAGPRG